MSLPLQPLAGAAAFAPAVTAGGAALWCDLNSPANGGRSLAHASVSLGITPVLWPLLSDIVIALPFGRLKPAAGPPINATGPIIEGCFLSAGVGRVSAANCSDVGAAARVPGALLHAVQAIFGSGPASPTPGAAPFTTTLSTATWLALRARSPPPGAGAGTSGLSAGVAVSIGGQACTVAAASSDGAWLIVQTPLAAALCPASIDCGYVVMGLGAAGLPNATLSCPPFCPGAFPSSVPAPQPQGSAYAIVPSQPQPSAFPVPAPAAALRSAAQSGVYYSRACPSGAAFTDPATGACTNASDPAALRCAYGSGDACSPCPEGGLCPGGFRLWSRPGYYTASESAGAVALCPPPSGRCTGWDIAQAATQCAAPYQQGSRLCSVCSGAHYLLGDGSCAACPATIGEGRRQPPPPVRALPPTPPLPSSPQTPGPATGTSSCCSPASSRVRASSSASPGPSCASRGAPLSTACSASSRSACGPS